MRPRLAAMLALLVVVLLVAVQVWRGRKPEASETRVAAARVTEPDRRLDLDGAFTRAELEARLEAAYRLPPDRRMTVALAHVTQVLSPSNPVAHVRASWTATEWALAVDSQPAGSLPREPAFADGLAAAEQWARTRWLAAPLPAGTPEGIATALLADAQPEEALAHLDATAARSGASLALLEQAMRACTQLSLLLREDRSSFADTTMARALALLAIANVAGGGSHPRERCTLAWAMGYTEEAAAIAATLPPADAIRALVLHRDAELAAAARQRGAPRETRLCDLLARARAGDFEGWRTALEATGDSSSRDVLSAYATALGFHRFDVWSEIGTALVHASLDFLPGAPRRVGGDFATIESFERALARPEVSRRGVLTGGAVAAGRRALFYSGLFAMNDFYLERLASPRVMREWSEQLPKSEPSAAAWFASWQHTLARDQNGEDVGLALRTHLEDPAVPAPFARVAFEALMERAHAGSVASRSAARTLAARLDTRPAWAYEFAVVAQRQVRWPTLTERLLSHAVRRAGNEMPSAVLTLAMMRDDRTRLAGLVSDPATDPDVAMRALRVWLGADSSAAVALLPRFATLAARRPEDWGLADAYADVLESRGRFAEAERVVLAWTLLADSTQDALESTVATTSLARLERKQGRLKDALATMGDLDRGQHHGAMAEKARLLSLTGALEPALWLAKAVKERYPQIPSANELPVELYWRAGRYEQAAKALAALLPDPSGEIFHEAAIDFGDVFGSRRADADRALQALRESVPGYPRLLWWIVREFNVAGNAKVAASLAEHAHPGSGGDRAFGVANTFQLLASARDHATARAWLDRQAMDHGARELVCGLLTMRGHAATAWDLEREMPEEDYTWLMRAASWRMAGGDRAAWRDTLRVHAQAAGGTLYPRLTGYLVRDVPESEVLALADSPKHRVEIWYHCALAAWSEGRARDVLFWMVLCQETGADSDGEYIWSFSALADWCGAWRVPERLGIALRPPA